MIDHARAGCVTAGSRALDIMASSIGFILASPVILFIILAILIESGRPLFFVQTRLGQGGREFRLFKFRKFRKGADEAGRPLTLRGDDRLSRVGRFLEASKLDELPQLYNILKGDMALVGPRPESLAFADCFEGETLAILSYRPGIFGPSQVAFRNENAFYAPGTEPTHVYRQVLFPTKAQLDLSYYPHRTLLSDSVWVLRGILAVAGVQQELVISMPFMAEQSPAPRHAQVIGATKAASGLPGHIF